MKNKKILFISHDATRAGAQLLLLDFLFWLKNNDKNFYFEILLVKGGELENEFRKLGVIYKWNMNVKFSYFNKIFHLFHQFKIRSKIKSKKFDLIYNNTIINGEILDRIANQNIPILTHVHELNYWIDKAGPINFNLIKKYTNYYIAASNAVKINLINKGISYKNIKIIYEFTDSSKISINSQTSLRSKLGLTNETLIIGASGAENFRKGKDLLILLATYVLKRTKLPVHFVWIGGEVSQEIRFDLNNIQCSNNIHFINHLSNAADYFSEFYVFAMLSRDDPFPVVNLEAGLRGVPIICFNNSGGTPELLEEEMDSIIAYMDLAAFGDRLLWFINNSPERDRIGQKLSQRIQEKYDLNVIAPKILDIINTLN